MWTVVPKELEREFTKEREGVLETAWHDAAGATGHVRGTPCHWDMGVLIVTNKNETPAWAEFLWFSDAIYKLHKKMRTKTPVPPEPLVIPNKDNYCKNKTTEVRWK